MTDHIGELAALYALGALSHREHEEVDAHIAHCDACVRLLAQAEDDVATLASAEPVYPAPAISAARIEAIFGSSAPKAVPAAPWWRLNWAMPLALAAAFMIALLPAGYLLRENTAMHQSMLVDAQVMARIATSPHRTVAFTGSSDAHVVYGPDGSWYVVVVRGAHAPLHVTWTHEGRTEMLGTVQPRGDVAMLYLPKSHRMDQLALMDGPRVVAEAQLVY